MATRTPSYRRHVSGQATVRIHGKDYYLGTYNSPRSKERYKDLIAELWEPTGKPDEWPSLEELMASYLLHAQRYYKDSNEASHIVMALRPLRALYGEEPTNLFGPKKLKRVQQEMVRAGLTRQGVNKRTVRIRRLFKWGVSEEMVPVKVLDELKTVQGLAIGRTDAPEARKVLPVPEDHLQAVLERVPAPIAALIRLQILTAARPGELVSMRRSDLDTAGDVWTFKPRHHKNQWRLQGREIFIGPHGQEILRQWLPLEMEAYVFSPRRYHGRRTFRECYDVRQLRVAIWKCCDQAAIPRWSPGRLRHNAAGKLREQFGIEAAAAVLGHTKPDTTVIYAQKNRALAKNTVLKSG